MPNTVINLSQNLGRIRGSESSRAKLFVLDTDKFDSTIEYTVKRYNNELMRIDFLTLITVQP
jgi:hypothetical protein